MGHPGGAGIVSANTTSVQGDGSGLKLVAGPDADYQQAHSHDEEEPVIQFPKRESAAPVELFYDLWFVANLNVFTTLHPITDVTNLGSFIKYFLLLWITWLITTVFDVRFGQDGVFERVARAAHLTVMIGFSAGGVSFSQTKQLQPIFKVMSLCLMCSRFVLAIQYGVVLFYARRNRRSRNNLALAVLLHLVPAFIYMAATIAMARGSDAKIDYLWWAVALGELAALMVHATLSKTVSFSGTHLTERLNLLTLIVIGEGIIILAKTITKIVQYTYLKDPTTSWSSALFGLIACGAAILYFTFQLYFDWMDHHSHMSPIKTAIWTVLHLPYHIAIVLTVEGSGQWITWRRTYEAINEALFSLSTGFDQGVSSGKGGQGVYDAVVEALDKSYKTYTFSAKTVSTMFDELSKLPAIPNSYWESFDANRAMTNPTANDTAVLDIYSTLQVSLTNAIFSTYGLTTSSKVKTQAEAEGETNQFNGEAIAYNAVIDRLVMILAYVFVAGGAALLLLSAMHLMQKPKGWSVFHFIRLGLLTIAGVALCLVALISTNNKMTQDMMDKPWTLPIIALVYLIALIGSHLPTPGGVKTSHSSQMEMGEHNKPGDTARSSPYHD
ncbi:hypothetical protein NCS57_00922300 [Fusarium keratoplasticum]|uniref:Uncharacterized protein n=1 Tax=Fusarium keratoplasticum TaxID=1328300 RepID=A0ACC0QQ71_9HYPO|nr:hypothetical protein NCS57_00922300 [Fusarium keratoplasticum]KAI8663220.1 hypothetical protein NCS57_00922300 [Fusarium keratoplasticum]